MAILKNVELYFAKLNPKKPNDRFDKENPTWEVQIRTRNKAQAKEWKELSINVKPDEDDAGVFYKATLKKRSKKRNGEDQNPVSLVGGDLSAIDPDKLGNGSVGNVRVYQYDYNIGGREGIATMLMAVQVTTYKEYEPKPREDDFEMTDMKVVKVADNQQIDSDDMVDDDLDF
jgi:hypothetical protein